MPVGRKCRYVLDELGFDTCIDHRAAELPAQLAAACPKGIDVYFENVGGAIWQAVLPLLNTYAACRCAGSSRSTAPLGQDTGPTASSR